MLVIRRRYGEKVYIGENICVTVVDAGNGWVKLGIQAPQDVPIRRQSPLETERAVDSPKVEASTR